MTPALALTLDALWLTQLTCMVKALSPVWAHD